MAGQQGSLWFVTEVAISRDGRRSREGSRSSEDVGGGFGSSVVQQTRKSLDPARADRCRGSEARDRESPGAWSATSSTRRGNETGMSLEEVELSIEVSSEGQISILGSGGKIGGSGGIKLSFKRQRPTS